MDKINFKRTNLFCDESGFSGNIKVGQNVEQYLKQPIFVTAGIFVESEIQFKRIELLYSNFLKKNNFLGRELKGELLSKKNNKILSEFIDLIINEDFWKISVIDKKFNIGCECIHLLSCDTFDSQSYNSYEILENNRDKIDFLINEYSKFIKTKNFNEFYLNIKNNIDFINYRHLYTMENLKRNYEKYFSNRKYLNVDHINSLSYLSVMKDPFGINPPPNLEIHYDEMKELSNIKNGDYFVPSNFFKEINFVDSKKSLIIQFADNISRVFFAYFKYMLYEKQNINADEVFDKLNINYFNKASLFMMPSNQNRFAEPEMDFRDHIDILNE
jgi:hypothetical protein